MSDVTRILSQIEEGDRRAAAELLPLVYDELRKLAAAKLAHEQPGQTLEATGLVHEAYLRLVENQEPGTRVQEPGDRDQKLDEQNEAPGSRLLAPGHFHSRGHFFAAAAEAMRRILVENARRKASLKRGGDRSRHDVDAMEIPLPDWPEDLLALDEALNKLAAVDPAAARLVHLRFFAGLAIPDAAEMLGISPRSADRLWAYARAWLYEAVQGKGPGS
jgi:DNA-directed RNA polymerase specialized sigma24 family protein